MKRNAHILKHIPDYYDNELSERKYFYDVLATLYPNETVELVKAAYRKRKQHNKQNKQNDDEQIELTSQMKQQIYIVYSTTKVRQLFKIIIATLGRVLSLIKKKATGKKEICPRLELPADLVAFADPPRRVRRLNPRDFRGANVIRRRQPDQPMEDASNDEEEEKNNASP